MKNYMKLAVRFQQGLVGLALVLSFQNCGSVFQSSSGNPNNNSYSAPEEPTYLVPEAQYWVGVPITANRPFIPGKTMNSFTVLPALPNE